MSGEASAAQTVSGGADGPITWRDELGLNGWDLVVLAATLLVAITTPLSLVFDYGDSAWWIFADVALSIPLAIDVRRRFARPVRLAGRLLEDPVQLRDRYLRSWFVVDVLAAIPFTALAAVPMLSGGPETAVKILALTRLLRMGRLLLPGYAPHARAMGETTRRVLAAYES